MVAIIQITPIHWVGFIGVVLFLLALDLGVFHRQAREVTFREAVGWTTLWVSLSLAFAGLLVPLRGKDEAIEFVTGYLIELSLSMDNVFVIALIFTYFRVPHSLQHRVLFWGILGALIMRGILIGLGAVLIAKFHWMLYGFGLFLVYTGWHMARSEEEGVHPESNWVVVWARRFFPLTRDYVGQHFLVRGPESFQLHVEPASGVRRVGFIDRSHIALTPLGLVLIMVETTDLVFALDSIPAIFAVTQKPFIIFTSNVFAILGLRSLYFVLAGAIKYFCYLKMGLSVVLIFIGAKMLLVAVDVVIPTGVSLMVVGGIILVAMGMSVWQARASQSQRPEGES